MSSNLSRRKFIAASAAAGATAAATALSPSARAAEEAPPAVKTVKIIGVACSYRKGKTTAAGIAACLAAAKEVSPNIETELIELAGLRIDGGIAAGTSTQDDDFGKVQEKLAGANVAAVIVGTPIYFGNMSSLCKAFLERCMALRRDWVLRNKVGAALAVGGSRNGGQEFAIHSIHACLFSQDMVVVGDGRPIAHMGATLWNNKDDVSSDTLGMTTAKNLGRRVAEVALKMAI